MCLAGGKGAGELTERITWIRLDITGRIRRARVLG